MIRVKISDSWFKYLASEFNSDYMKDLSKFLRVEKSKNKIIYPKGSRIFHAFNLTPFERVKVVILGQDPYHGPLQANGLSFSVNANIPKPPSLRNIFKELNQDLHIKPKSSGCLDHWSEQGVLLLNTCLTVEQGKPASHRNKGWEKFTTRVLEILNAKKKYIVYILWGKHAQDKVKFVNRDQNLIIFSAHPSPLSAHKGFFGSKPFSRTNFYLKKTNQKVINW